MPPEKKKHIIAARNILFGTGYFLILPLSEGWGITRSYLPPDVHSTVLRENITWVEAGQTDQVLFHPHRRIALDLVIQIKRGRQEGLDLKGVRIFAQGSGFAGGHPAAFGLGEVRQGLLKRKTRKTLRVCFYCPELQRTLCLQFTGGCQDADLKELHESLAEAECH